MENFFETKITEQEIRYEVQSGKGRPGPNTKYKIVVEEFKDSLNQIQLTILSLLQMSEDQYWPI